MKELKYHSYDRGFCRAYFRADKKLYCLQGDDFNRPHILICSGGGEPSHPVDSTNFYFTGFDVTRWSMADLHVYFGNCRRCGDFMRLLDNLFEGAAA